MVNLYHGAPLVLLLALQLQFQLTECTSIKIKNSKPETVKLNTTPANNGPQRIKVKLSQKGKFLKMMHQKDQPSKRSNIKNKIIIKNLVKNKLNKFPVKPENLKLTKVEVPAAQVKPRTLNQQLNHRNKISATVKMNKKFRHRSSALNQSMGSNTKTKTFSKRPLPVNRFRRHQMLNHEMDLSTQLFNNADPIKKIVVLNN